MSVTAAQVKNYAPELTPVLDARVDTFIAFAELRVNRDQWLDLGDLAVILLTAHMLSVAGGANGGTGSGASPRGQVTDETVGDLSRSYSDLAGVETITTFMSGLGGTSYGLEFLELRKTLVITPILVC